MCQALFQKPPKKKVEAEKAKSEREKGQLKKAEGTEKPEVMRLCLP